MMARKGTWVKIEETKYGDFNDEFLKNPMSVVQLLTKVLRYQGLIYNRIGVMQEQLDKLTFQGFNKV